MRTVTTAWGGQLTIDNRQAIGRAIETTGVFDLTVSEFLSRLTGPGSHVVDVGGNIGYMSVLLACKASPGGSLTAFEPHPELFQKLTSNLARNAALIRLAQIHLRPLAVGSCPGRARLIFPADFSQNDGTAHLAAANQMNDPGVDVGVTTLDTEFPEGTIDVMKLDVEGHESSVLAGGEKLFSDHRVRHLIFEAHEGKQSPVCQRLLGWGYQLHRLGWSSRRPELAPLAGPGIHRPYESPSFLATIDWPDVLTCCSATGWQCLRPFAKPRTTTSSP
jgi:FkbM family methyltransferase